MFSPDIFAWVVDPQIWAGFAALTALEIVLGVDNLVFLALLAGRLPEADRARARRIGLALALGMRLLLLGSVSWLVHLTDPVITLWGLALSWRDIVLIGGGAFLIYKGTSEIHERVDGHAEERAAKRRPVGFAATIVQIVLFDVVFSLDSVITAVGVAEQIGVMVAAIVAAMALMLLASDKLAEFVERYASVKMLALAFLLLVGMTLLADGLGFHIPRGYVYAAMGFSITVEALNLLASRRRGNGPTD
jgi:predicted tellurium resistance membrane protein TerC